jgi:hypothetical protein
MREEWRIFGEENDEDDEEVSSLERRMTGDVPRREDPVEVETL